MLLRIVGIDLQGHTALLPRKQTSTLKESVSPLGSVSVTKQTKFKSLTHNRIYSAPELLMRKFAESTTSY